MENTREETKQEGRDVNLGLNEFAEDEFDKSPSDLLSNHCADDNEETLIENHTENQNSSKCLADDSSIELSGQEAVSLNLTNEFAPTFYAKKLKSELADLNYELQQAYRILRDLMSDGHKGINSPFMDSVETTEDDIEDYYEVITKPMWLKKVRHKFLRKEYSTITEFVADVRLILENCYRFNGPDSPYTKKALRLEQILEQKLALLPRDLRDKTSLELTSGKPINDDIIGARRRSTRQSLEYTSILLNLVRHEKGERNRELKKKLTEEKKVEKVEKEKEVLDWEDKLLEDPLKMQMKAMWELPLIGHFFYLCQTVLNMPEVSQFELERILVMPRASSLLPKIMTSLLSNPTQRAGLDRNPPMPYKVWQSRLQNRIQSWYKIFHAREKRADLVFQQLGIEANFFKILGPENPLNEKQFHDLSFHQKIWCIKGLCDYILYNHRTIQDALNEQVIDDMREYILGRDTQGNIYLHFPQFCGQDLRIYRQKQCHKPPSSICWGAPCTPKRKLPKMKKPSSPPPKKTKIEPKSLNKTPVKKILPRVTPALNTRRSPRLSKISELPEKMEVDELESSESESTAGEDEDLDEDEEENTDDSDSDEEDDDENVKPNIAKFEMVVDSVESLRMLIEKFKDAYEDASSQKAKPGKKCEADLCKRLANLLAELEPWEAKLLKSAQRIRNRLRREWDDFDEDEEEIEDIWGSDGESDGEKSSTDVSDSDNSNNAKSISNDVNAIVRQQRPIRNAQKAVKEIEISTEDLLNQDDDSCEYRTRGRLKQLRDMRNHPSKIKRQDRTVRLNGSNSHQKDLLLEHSLHNTTTQAKELYAWETLRQILVPTSDSKDALQRENNDDNCRLTKSIHPNQVAAKQLQTIASSPEKQNLIHAKLDMLVAMQAAMRGKASASTSNSGESRQGIKTIVPKKEPLNNNHILKANILTKSALSALKLPEKIDSTTLNKVQAAIPTKQQLNDLSSVAENTQSLKRLLDRGNVAPSSPVTVRSSLPTKAQVMFFPMVDASGKSVVYRVTSNKNSSSANNFAGLDAKKIAMALATSTASALPPGLVVEKIPTEGNTLHQSLQNIATQRAVKAPAAFRPAMPVVKSPRASIRSAVIEQIASLSTHTTVTSSSSCASKMAPVIPSKTDPQLQLATSTKASRLTPTAVNPCTLISPPRPQIANSKFGPYVPISVNNQHQHVRPVLVSSTNETAVSTSVIQQQVLLVPVRNQQGQTVYLQIPTQTPVTTTTLDKPVMATTQKNHTSFANTTLSTQVVSPTVAAQPQPTLSNVLTNRTIFANTKLSTQVAPPAVAAHAQARDFTSAVKISAPAAINRPVPTQRLIPALSSKRQISQFSSRALVSEPPPLAPLSKPRIINPKPLGVQLNIQGASVRMPQAQGSTPAAANIHLRNNQSATHLPTVPNDVARTTFSGTFSVNSLAEKPILAISAPSPSPNNNLNVSNTYFQPANRQLPINRLGHSIQPSVTTQVANGPVSATVVADASPMVGATAAVLPTQSLNQANAGSSNLQAEVSIVDNNIVISTPNSNSATRSASEALSASFASIVASNPVLVATIQKLVGSGNRVTIERDGNNLVLHANPKVGVPSPQIQAKTTDVQPSIGTPQSTAVGTSNTGLGASANLAHPSPIRTSPTIHMPETRMISGPICTPAQIVNPNSAANVSQIAHSSSATPITNLPSANPPAQHKLVMIRDTASDKQSLGILLENGQVVPLNANISFTNASVS